MSAELTVLAVDDEAPALDEGIDEALKDFIARKKGSMEDMWY